MRLIRMLSEEPLKFGLIYSAVLWWFAFMACGFGHGTYVPLAVSSAPAGLLPLPGAVAVAVLLPFFWIVVFFLLSQVNNKGCLWIFVAVMVIHYATAALLSQSKQWNDWENFEPKQLGQIAAWLPVYFGGQYMIWREFSKRINAKPLSAGTKTGQE